MKQGHAEQSLSLHSLHHYRALLVSLYPVQGWLYQKDNHPQSTDTAGSQGTWESFVPLGPLTKKWMAPCSTGPSWTSSALTSTSRTQPPSPMCTQNPGPPRATAPRLADLKMLRRHLSKPGNAFNTSQSSSLGSTRTFPVMFLQQFAALSRYGHTWKSQGCLKPFSTIGQSFLFQVKREQSSCFTSDVSFQI